MTPAPIAATNATAIAAKFADAMSTLASGVVLVTCRLADRPWGMTVTAFASVSAYPPTVLVSLGSETATARAIAATSAFGVSVLSRDQVDVAEYGAARGAAKFLDSLIEPRDRESASPAIAQALAHLDCDVVEAVDAADHTVFFGYVHTVRRRSGGDPLLYHGRGYRSFFAPAQTTERNLRCVSS
jgi:flavin reductase (DIM6/NTAB) family NADH-FMN oxidoreductase RutF